MNYLSQFGILQKEISELKDKNKIITTKMHGMKKERDTAKDENK